MPNAISTSVLRHLARTDTTVSDRDLLAKFVADRDDAAFGELVRRHGPVVLATCRRSTRHFHDADDAFQAVFVTLARRAASVQNPDLLGSWLYQVAVRVAWRARRAASRRRAHEVPTADVPESVAPAPPEHGDLGAVLDEELARLPAWHRDAVILCDLQGLSRAAAAARLGVPLGTLASRLDKARRRLAERLTRRGVTLTVAAMPGVLADLRAAAVPASLLDKACGLATGAVPGMVLQLAHGGVMMRMATAMGLLTASLALAAVGLAPRPGDGQTPVAPPPRPVVDIAAPPKEVVLRAWDESLAGLKSGVGEGAYEEAYQDGRTFRYAMKVEHAGPKFRVELARLQPPGPTWPAGPPIPALVAICDGQTLAYRELPLNEEALLVPAPPGYVFRHARTLMRLNPAALPATFGDLPALVRGRPGLEFAYGPDGVSATDRAAEMRPAQLTLRFPRTAGYNVASSAFVRAGGGYKQVVTATWARSNGAWYVREVERATVWPEGTAERVSEKLTYTTFEANAEVDPGRFRLPALGLAKGARLLYSELSGKVEFYHNDPPAEDRPGDTLLDGLRRLPLRYPKAP